VKIGIDASSVIRKKTGIGSFASSLIEEVRRQAKDIEFLLYRPRNGNDLNTPQRMVWEAASIWQKARADRISLLYSPGFSPPPFGPFKKIVTVHDLIGLIYPENVGRISRFYWSVWLPHNIRRADRLVASSDSTRRDIERLLGIPAKRVEVVPLAARPYFRDLKDKSFIETVLAKYNVQTPYIISVGTLEPRKNLLTLLRAYEKLNSKSPEASLVIVGKPGGAEKELQNFIDEKFLTLRVKILGYVTDEELSALYNGAVAYAMISLYEGFGLPVLEAMSCRLTGVVSNNSSLPEVVGDTAIQVDPLNVGAVAEALKTLLEDEPQRRHLAGAALARSGDFSIQKTAKQMLDIFRTECGS